jgi:DNA-binding Lrp family transcriptional regulator
MMSEVFKMDEIDKKIISLVQEHPNLTHTQIAEKVNRSQPTVGMRIRRLEELGVLQFQAGINLKITDLSVARVDIQTNRPNEIFEIAKKCPYILNAFRMSGEFDVSIFIANNSIEDLETIVNYHFRRNPNVMRVSVEIITDVMRNFIIPFDFETGKCECALEKFCWKRD